MFTVVVKKLLGVERFRELHSSWTVANEAKLEPRISTLELALAFLIAMLPFFAAYLVDSRLTSYTMTLAVGVAALLAIIYRIRKGIPFLKIPEWSLAMRLTHTAFALGCVPAVILLLMDPAALTGIAKEEVVVTDSAMTASTGVVLFWILRVALWAGMTEEFIYRGLLISFMRRWHGFKSQLSRDTFAVVVSSAMFALGHLPIWGPHVSLAIFGLGLGLGVAYIAIGELVLPLVIYHTIFNSLSLGVAIYFRS